MKEFDIQDWVEFAANNASFNQSVTEFIKQNKDQLYNPERDVTPRKWELVSNFMNEIPMEQIKDQQEFEAFLYGILGETVTPFANFVYKK